MQDISPLHIAENLSDLEKVAKRLEIGKTKNSSILQNAIKTLYKNILEENYDQEKCYMYCLRYLVTIQRMSKLGDEKFVQAMYKSEIARIQQKLDELRPVLEKRYQELHNLKKKPGTTTKKSINSPIQRELFPGEFISCSELYDSILQRRNILLVDVRCEKEFKSSQIVFDNVINIPGENLVPGLSANALSGILNSDEAKEKWGKRDKYEALVFLDWNTASDNVISPKLNILRLAVAEWDCLRNYKQHPVILCGGFKEFFERYPVSVSNVHINYIRRNEDIDELLELDSISYPDANVSVMNLKEFTIEKLEESFKTEEVETIEEKTDDIANVEYPDIDENLKNEEKIVTPKGGEYDPKLFPDPEREKEVEEIKDIKKKLSPSIIKQSIEETKLKLLAEARKLKRKSPPSHDNKENIPEGPVGDQLTNKRPPPIRRETKPQKIDINRGWCGIYNIRNICYMSTVMQCLKCIPVIKKICQSSKMLSMATRPPVILHEFINMVAILWEGTEEDVKVTKPYPFYNAVCRLDDTFGKGRHEDCMEFFLFLLNNLDDDCSSEIQKLGVMTERQKAWYNHLQGRSSFWADLFYHQFMCTKICQVCSTKAVTYETDNTLMLSVPHHTKYRRIHMKQLIHEYMEDYQIMDYKCSKCQQMKVVNTKSVVVAPEILVIVLKRYYQDEYRDMKKNNIPVDFEEKFEFGGFGYELCSVAQHMGTMDVGHYFAAGRIPDGWVQFNDERVSRYADIDGYSRCGFASLSAASHFSKSAKIPVDLSVNSIVKSLKDDRNITLKELPSLLPKIDFANVTSEEATGLLDCCGKATANVSNDTRNQTCQQIYQFLLKSQKLDLDLFHTYIKICNDNLQPVDYREFLKLSDIQPTKDTYKLLLQNVCEQGDVTRAYEILQIMKDKQTPVDEEVFGSLILCHTLQGGLSGAEPVLQTMKTAHIPETNSIILNLFKGLLRTKNYDDFRKCLQKYPIRLSDQEFLSMLEFVGLTGNLDIYKEVQFLFKNIIATHELQVKIEDVCLYLIHMGQFETAMNIYKNWVTFAVDEAYGETLFKEMFNCNARISEYLEEYFYLQSFYRIFSYCFEHYLGGKWDIHQIISLANQIRQEEKNDFILEKLTGVALQNGYVEKCYELFNHVTVKCHYFWPLLVAAGKSSDGEMGIFTVLQKMKSFNIRPDAETFETYIFPFCKLADSKLLISRFQREGFTLKETASPLIIFLLRKNLVKPAFEIYNSFDVDVFNTRFVGVLARSWLSTLDSETIVKFLKKYRDSKSADSSLLQLFLVKALRLCRSEIDYQNFLKCIEIIKSENFRVNFSTANNIMQLLQKCPNDLKNNIKVTINSMLEVGDHMQVEDTTGIPHPRNMSTPDLECHLIELEEKNMETRGVIRRLIQAHSREGNIDRVAELRTKLQNLGYKESAGMKSLIMHNYILAGQLEVALNVFDEIKQEFPNFALDSFKCIDLARLMVENLRFDEAMRFLEEESRKLAKINTESVQRNCRELLMACKKEEEQTIMFDLLLRTGLCKPTNILLGPLIRILLNKNDIPAAVEKYTELAAKYRRTPLQRELLSAVSKAENSELLQRVLTATQEVHGSGQTRVGLIAALAETSQVKPLRKVLVQTNIVIQPLLERQYKRWIEENKIEPLLTISRAAERLPSDVASLEFLNNCIIDIYERQNDCDAALNFYENLPDDNFDKPKIERKVLNLLKKNKSRLPKSSGLQ